MITMESTNEEVEAALAAAGWTLKANLGAWQDPLAPTWFRPVENARLHLMYRQGDDVQPPDMDDEQKASIDSQLGR